MEFLPWVMHGLCYKGKQGKCHQQVDSQWKRFMKLKSRQCGRRKAMSVWCLKRHIKQCFKKGMIKRSTKEDCKLPTGIWPCEGHWWLTRMVSVKWWEWKLAWGGFRREKAIRRLKFFAIKGSIKEIRSKGMLFKELRISSLCADGSGSTEKLLQVCKGATAKY